MRQALEAVRMTTGDESVHEQVVRRLAREINRMDMSLSPPAMGQRFHRLIRELTGDPDPYRVAKERTNRLAMALYPAIRDRVAAASNPLEMAVRMAIAGNVFDFAVDSRNREEMFRHTMDRAATARLHGDLPAFVHEATAADSILYLTDNAGEIVFDRVLVETLGPHRVTVGVRGRPVLNDALRTDADAAGLTGLVEVVDNGSDAPGTMLDDCTAEFRSRFMGAALVIAKGQGNYETLSDAPRPVWFALLAKCEVIARHIGCEPGSFVLHRLPGGYSPATGAP
jgi:uncharacterized protein with ATP-grasp and redox domains